jgi:hypothetical protein
MKYITILEDHGLIEAQKRRDEAGDMTSTEYILLTPSLDDAIEGVSTSETPSDVSQPERHRVSTSETPKEPEVSQPLGDRVSTSETFQEPLNKITQKENQEVRTPRTPLLTPQSLMELYNTFTPVTHPKVERLTDARKQKAVLYLRQFPDQSFWETVCLEISQSSLLLGLKPSQGHEHFKGTFDWLLTKGKNDQVENCVKVFEGRYRDVPSHSSPEPNGRISEKGRRSVEAARRIIEDANHGTDVSPGSPTLS